MAKNVTDMTDDEAREWMRRKLEKVVRTGNGDTQVAQMALDGRSRRDVWNVLAARSKRD